MTAKHQLLVIGGGAAGLATAFGAGYLGVDVALVERGRLGGECTWWGCIPSKTLIDVARQVKERADSEHLGIHSQTPTVDFPAVMDHVRSVSREVARAEDETALAEAGVEFYRGNARFVDSHRVRVDGVETIQAAKIVIATGADPVMPDGLAPAEPLTSKNIWDLDVLPDTLIVVGGGSVGSELGQAVRRLGSDVHLITDADRLIPEGHPDASRLLEETFRSEGIQILTGERATKAERVGRKIVVETESGQRLSGSHLLVAVGTQPNLSDLNLDAAGVAMSDEGRLELDDSLRTSQPHISAAGDVAGGGFTHIAADHARTSIKNLISPMERAHSDMERWATFTDPEIAQVGALPDRGGVRSDGYTTRLPLRRVDRAMVSVNRAGFIEVYHTKPGRILGVTLVGPDAAELANQWVSLVGRHITALLDVRTIYPTMGSSIPVVGSEWVKARLQASALGLPGRLLLKAWLWLKIGTRRLLRRASSTER